jgi:hypothetical protein
MKDWTRISSVSKTKRKGKRTYFFWEVKKIPVFNTQTEHDCIER